MYFADLTNYSYFRSVPFDNVFNIGWLDLDHEYNLGGVSDCFIEKLAILINGSDCCQVHVNKIRGVHPCEICGLDVVFEKIKDMEILLGASEVWIPFDKGWYASPSMVLHYVRHHGYAPPVGFVDAVISMDLRSNYSGQSVYDKLCLNFNL
ncbi:hypothetical protein HNQ59_003895 [Chitinivorax tropicus]|uniref:DUF7919 domain-containing protein n=1 Tax=Chitinivorax tropicus TaxID=714531 RepID=A0A840MN61_9PROT|nr:hypothetical protein [Chitinivorax tropicus]MBB5020574.1 hypothetical protein [Chitinivorax tropicus]